MLIHAVYHPGGDGPLPTLIALHGRGAHALDLLSLGPFFARGRLLMICPQAEHPIEEGFGGYTWFSRRPDGSLDQKQLDRAVESVREFIAAALERYPADPSRTALLGFSQGGMLGYRLALAEPQRFAGFAALSSTFSSQQEAPVEPGEGIGELKVLIQHGTADPLISIEQARESREQLRALGLEPDYHEYAMAHEITDASARDLTRWLERVLKLTAN